MQKIAIPLKTINGTGIMRFRRDRDHAVPPEPGSRIAFQIIRMYDLLAAG